MQLDQHHLIHYLTGRGLISPERVLSGDLRIVAQSGRHSGFRIESRSAPGIFVKQSRADDPAAAAFLRREAWFYRQVAEDASFASLRGRVPAFCAFDAAASVLAIELVPGAVTLSQIHARTRSAEARWAGLLGQSLGSWHQAPPLPAGDVRFADIFPGELPFVLQLHRGPWPRVAAAALPVLAALRQESRLVAALEGLAAGYRPEGLIHGDMKFDNCLIFGEETPEPRLKFIDWEIADRGDTAWDVAGVVQCYLLTFLQGVFGLPAMQAAGRVFWRAYSEARGFAAADAARELRVVWRLAAARLFQTALEYTLAPGSPPWPLIGAGIQLGRTILGETESSLRDVAGLGP